GRVAQVGGSERDLGAVRAPAPDYDGNGLRRVLHDSERTRRPSLHRPGRRRGARGPVRGRHAQSDDLPPPSGRHRPEPVRRFRRDRVLDWRGANGISSQRLAADGLRLEGDEHKLVDVDQPWEGKVVEGRSMVHVGGRYFLFYSGNDWSSRNYAVGYAS